MYRLRYSFALNKPYLPTFRQFSNLPYFKKLRESNAEKAKLIKELDESNVEKTKLIKELEERNVAKTTLEGLVLIKDRKIEELTKDYGNEKRKQGWLYEIDKEHLRNELVSKRFENEMEIARLEKEIVKVKADRRLEKERAEADR